MITLAINTSNSSISLALFLNGNLLDFSENNQSGKQSELLLVEIESFLKKNNINYFDVGLIAASSGPGSFTGTRIGITCAKTLQIAIKKPLILVNNLEAAAFASKSSSPVFIALEAPANETFIARYHETQELDYPSVIASCDLENFLLNLPKDFLVIRKNINQISAKEIGEYAVFISTKKRAVSNQICYLRDPKIGIKTK